MSNTIILLGYDYLKALIKIANDESVFCVILEKDKKYFKQENLQLLKKAFGDRLIDNEVKQKDIEDLIKKLKITNLITLGWRHLINIERFKNLNYLINVHPALLPEYKGFHPVPDVILNDEKIHGITAHIILQEMDAGDIVLKESFSINPFSTLNSLQNEVIKRMPNFMAKLMKVIKRGQINLLPNNNSETKVMAAKRTPEDSKLELNETLLDVFKKVKASDLKRFPAYFEYMGEKVFVTMKRSSSAKRNNKYDI